MKTFLEEGLYQIYYVFGSPASLETSFRPVSKLGKQGRVAELRLNGDYGSSSSGDSGSSSGYGGSSGYGSNTSGYATILSYDNLTSGLDNTRDKNDIGEKSGNKADEIDRTNSSFVKENLSDIGYRLLSEENTNGYTAGSERKYYQEMFENLKNDPESNTSTREITIEGFPCAGFRHENLTEYLISSNGNIQLRVIDVNNDGKVDYVYKY